MHFSKVRAAQFYFFTGLPRLYLLVFNPLLSFHFQSEIKKDINTNIIRKKGSKLGPSSSNLRNTLPFYQNLAISILGFVFKYYSVFFFYILIFFPGIFSYIVRLYTTSVAISYFKGKKKNSD